jgi:hypothetical protein
MDVKARAQAYDANTAIQGGELHFEMGPAPKPDSVSDKELPYSASMEM